MELAFVPSQPFFLLASCYTALSQSCPRAAAWLPTSGKAPPASAVPGEHRQVQKLRNTLLLSRALTFRVIFLTEPTPKSLILGDDESQVEGAFILGHFWPRRDFFNPIAETRAGWVDPAWLWLLAGAPCCHFSTWASS